MNTTTQNLDTSSCPVCGSSKIETSIQQEDFNFLLGDHSIPLSASFPVQVCKNCNFVSYGEEGEEAKDRVVRQYLKLLLPSEIKGIREKYQLSRQAFAELTGIGVASLARWENGEVMQNKSNNNLLRFISDPENFKALKDGFSINELGDKQRMPKLRALNGEDLTLALKLKGSFNLHLWAQV